MRDVENQERVLVEDEDVRQEKMEGLDGQFVGEEVHEGGVLQFLHCEVVLELVEAVVGDGEVGDQLDLLPLCTVAVTHTPVPDLLFVVKQQFV